MITEVEAYDLKRLTADFQKLVSADNVITKMKGGYE